MIILVLKNGHRITRIASHLIIAGSKELEEIVTRNLGDTKGLSDRAMVFKSRNLIDRIKSEGMWSYSLQKWNPNFNCGWLDRPIYDYHTSIGTLFEKDCQFKAWVQLIDEVNSPL